VDIDSLSSQRRAQLPGVVTYASLHRWIFAGNEKHAHGLQSTSRGRAVQTDGVFGSYSYSYSDSEEYEYVTGEPSTVTP